MMLRKSDDSIRGAGAKIQERGGFPTMFEEVHTYRHIPQLMSHQGWLIVILLTGSRRPMHLALA